LHIQAYLQMEKLFILHLTWLVDTEKWISGAVLTIQKAIHGVNLKMLVTAGEKDPRSCLMTIHR